MYYIKKIKANYYPLVVSYGSLIFIGAMLTLFIVIMNPLSQRLNVPISQISILISLQAVGTAFTSYFAGIASDKLGRKKVIFLGLVFYLVFLIGMIFTNNFIIACLLALLSGMGQGFMDPPALSLLVDIFGDKSGPAMSLVFVFFSFGGFLSSLITNKLIVNNIDFSIIYYIFIAISLVLFYIILKSPYPTSKRKPQIKRKDSSRSNSNKIIIILSGVTFFYLSAETIIKTWLNIYSTDILHLTTAAGVSTLSYFHVGSIIGAFIFAYLLTKIHVSKFLFLNGVLTTLSIMLFIRSDGYHMFYVTLIGLFLTVTFSFSLNLAGELFEDNPGGGTGLMVTASTVARIITAFVTGKGLEIYGIREVFISSIILTVIATLFAVIFRHYYKKMIN